MESLKLILKLILTPFLSVSIMFLNESNLFLYPLVFSIILSLSNYELLKLNLFIGIILGIGISYFTFFIGYFGYGVFYKLIELVGINNDITIGEWFYSDLAGSISVFIIAPLLTMYLLKLLFKNTKTRLTYWILLITVLINLILSFLHRGIDSDNFFNLLNMWQLIVMFGLQAIINQKLITKKLKVEYEASSQQSI
jgi:hypothetical protein